MLLLYCYYYPMEKGRGTLSEKENSSQGQVYYHLYTQVSVRL